MKALKIITLSIPLFALFIAMPATAQTDGAERQALRKAVDEARAAMEDASIGKGNISLLPLHGDDTGYVEGLLKNAVTAAGLKYVEGKNDPLWDEIIKEVAWDEKKGDMLDNKTIAPFGDLQGTEMLMYGVVRTSKPRENCAYAEIELHLTKIATKEHVWGGVFTYRIYGPDVQPIVQIDPEVRQALQDLLSQGAQSLKQSNAAAKMDSALVVPFAGDLDNSVTGMAMDMFNDMDVKPRVLDVDTLGEARMMLRDTPDRADALLYGAVREMSRELKHEEFLQDVYEINLFVQMQLQDAQTGDVLWSKTLSDTYDDVEERSEEGLVRRFLEKHPNFLLYVLGGIAVLVVLLVLIKKGTRVR